MAYVKKLKDSQENTVYPQTVVGAVYDDSNQNLETILSDLNSKIETLEENQKEYILPIATTTSLGGVKVDGTTININEQGVISTQSSLAKFANGTYIGKGSTETTIALDFIPEYIKVSARSSGGALKTAGNYNVYYIEGELIGYTAGGNGYAGRYKELGGENYEYVLEAPSSLEIKNNQSAGTVGYTGKGFKVQLGLNLSGVTYHWMAIGK